MLGVNGLLAETYDSLFYVLNNFQMDLSDGEVIVWDNEVINHGGHYSRETGAYTAPYNGMYQ